MPRLTPSQERAALAVVEALIPPGRRMPGAGVRTVERSASYLASLHPVAVAAFGRAAEMLDGYAVFRGGRRFHRLSSQQRERLLRRWEQDPVAQWPLALVSLVAKTTHFDDPEIYKDLGCVYNKSAPPEPARWLQQVRSGEEWEDGAEIECDVAVVGTGAGGAVVGKELAEKGYAVVFLEEGRLHRRDEFSGSAHEAHRKFYRNGGGVFALGNSPTPVFMGKAVGGSTTINSGTSFRTPSWILEKWCERVGTDELSAEDLAPYFKKVETELGIGPNEMKHIGPIGEIVARGCDKLGWHHFPVPRNAPDCDGQGVCEFGCPTDAKRSTNVSYIPAALQRSAVLFTSAKAQRVLIENGRAVGVLAKSVKGGKTLWVRSRAAVLACGGVPTPLFLMEQGICNSSGQVGRNLTIHPSTIVSGDFDDDVEGYNHIPQGYGCDEFHRDGILLLGGQLAINVAGPLFPFGGRRFMDVMDRLPHIASFGVLIEDDTQNGRVRRDVGGFPVITYNYTKNDVRRLKTGMEKIFEIFQAAGAKKIYPYLRRFPILDGEHDIARFRKMDVKAGDFRCVGVHPIGTCRMGADPKTSVVGPDHQAHDVPALFIVDGSSVPGPPAVNPQLTIMTMATRAAEKIAQALG